MSRLIMETIQQSITSSQSSYDAVSLEEHLQQLDDDLQSIEHEEHTIDVLEIAQRSLESTATYLEHTHQEKDTELIQQLLNVQLGNTSLRIDDLRQEDLSEKIAAIGEKVSQGITNIQDKLASAFESLHKSAEELAQRQEQLAGRVSNLSSDANTADEVKVKSANKVHIAGDFTPSTVASGLNSTQQTVSEGLEQFITTIGQIFESIQDINDKQLDAARQGEKADAKQLAEDHSAQVTKIKNEYNEAIGNLADQDLCGGQRLAYKDKEIAIQVTKKKGADHPSSRQTIDTPSVSDIESVLEGAKALIDYVQQMQDTHNQFLQRNQQALENHQQFVEEYNNNPLSKWLGKRFVQDQYSQIGAHNSKMIGEVQKYIVKTANAAMDYAEMLIEAYEVE